MVNMWAVADQNRLWYLHAHQAKLRAALYSGLKDTVSSVDDNIDLNQLDQRFILPLSYTGGPRNIQQNLQDSLALAHFYRKIDLFITQTCNPQWVEIQQELFPGQTASDYPDLIS